MRLAFIDVVIISLLHCFRAHIFPVGQIPIRTRLQEYDTTTSRLYAYLSLWLIGTVRSESETVISRSWVQSPDPAE